ncbi:FBP domain-containing protein [Streptomyces thermocarboxydus]
MKALTERDIRGSFINCSKGEAKRLHVPRDLDGRPWDDLDFLGWGDPGALTAAIWSSKGTTGSSEWRCASSPPSGVSSTAACAPCV